MLEVFQTIQIASDHNYTQYVLIQNIAVFGDFR